jgi:hypothetical protein
VKKPYDCVDSKHRAAARLQKQLAGMEKEEQLRFWRRETQALKAERARLLRRRGSGERQHAGEP